MDKNLVSYKALRFTTESNRSSMLYEVKRARAVFDPSLAIPGTNRRGGYRCPVGTRYGGQITDRFGRNCGWGVARRLANEISDLGERLESVGDRRRERKLRQRNERMAGRLAGQAGAIERAAGRVGDAADVTGRQGGRRNRVGADAPRPAGRIERAAGRIAEVVNPDKPQQGRARRADAPQAPAAPAAPRGRRQVQAEPRPRPAAARRPRRNLRPSEERRMEREINEPGAPRTGEAAPAAPRPEPRPRPAAPRRPANAGRRRRPEPANNQGTASRQNEGKPARKPTPVPAGQSDNAARSAEVRERDNATNRRRLFMSGGGVRENDLNQVLNDDNFKEYVIREIIPNDRVAILNDDRNFPDSAARKRSKADEARQKITVAQAKWDGLEDAINRGKIADSDFFEGENGERIRIGQVRNDLRDYRNAWQQVYDRNNAQPARAENTVEQARRQVEAAQNPPRVPTVQPEAQSDPAAREMIERRLNTLDIPAEGLNQQQLRKYLGDKFDQDFFDQRQAFNEWQLNEGIPNDMAMWRQGDIDELQAVLQNREQAIVNERSGLQEAARLFANEPSETNANLLIEANARLQNYRAGAEGMKRRLGELRNPQAEQPNVPEPSPAPEIPNPPEPIVPSGSNRPPSLPAQPMRLADNDDVRGRTEAQWRQFFEAQNEQDIPVRVQRAMDAARNGNRDADENFNGMFNGGGDNMLQIRDRAAMGERYQRRLSELNQDVYQKRRAYDAADPANRDNYRLKQRDLIQAIAQRDRFSERRTEIEAALAAPAPEPLNSDIARKAEARVKDAIAKRQQVLGEHLDRVYGPGNAPWKEMTLDKRRELLAKANDRNASPTERANAKNALESWAKAMYNHAEIQGSNGKTYRTVMNANLSGSTISVSGVVQVKNADGTWSQVGTSGRTIYLDQNKVYNNSLIISAQAHKNNGIQTIYNQHAFMYAKAAGFEKFEVTAAYDGPYVWGRIGFEPSASLGASTVGRMAAQLTAFRNGNASSIIKNAEDANIIEYLIDKHRDDPASVRHMDFIYALSNPARTNAQRKARDAELRDWFVSNMPMGGGTFWLDKNLIKADPRD